MKRNKRWWKRKAKFNKELLKQTVEDVSRGEEILSTIRAERAALEEDNEKLLEGNEKLLEDNGRLKEEVKAALSALSEARSSLARCEETNRIARESNQHLRKVVGELSPDLMKTHEEPTDDRT